MSWVVTCASRFQTPSLTAVKLPDSSPVRNNAILAEHKEPPQTKALSQVWYSDHVFLESCVNRWNVFLTVCQSIEGFLVRLFFDTVACPSIKCFSDNSCLSID